VRVSAQSWSRTDRKKRFTGATDAKSIPIGPIVLAFGGEVKEGKNVSVKCVLHNDSRRSAVIDTIANLYFCHTCGKGGNAVNLVCILENMGFKDGVKRALEIVAGSGATIRTGNNSRNSSRTRRTWDL
jgi:DNA primase